MLEVIENKVDFSINLEDPIIKMLYEKSPEKVEKAIIEVNLFAVFMAVSDKYGLGTCADIVQKAMEKVSDQYKKEDKNGSD